MSEVVNCSECKKETDMSDTFIFEGKNYCMDCLYSLIMAMYESGIINIDMNNCEEDGMIISG